MKTYKNFKIGDRVTVKIATSGHCDQAITPDMSGTIKGFFPKVRIMPVSVKTDALPYFVYVEFDKTFNPPHNSPICGGINIKNLQKVK